ncbi:hypothetical protein [Marinobacterium jannaschii]|uniref:hypothetical protein n=1 Tax=Marinobacterium jannaschii TaxID=64970 RepID=UPI0004864E66|nr:hypothetical protein [Marinobacterium jannaschii]
MKRTLIILLVAACVGITIYLNKSSDQLSLSTKSEVEKSVLGLPTFPARPVWWQNDSVLAVGVVKKSDNHDQDAVTVCKIAKEHGVTDLLVEIYDIVEIQQNDNWTRIGSANCAAMAQ